jgi:hypothetical protein
MTALELLEMLRSAARHGTWFDTPRGRSPAASVAGGYLPEDVRDREAAIIGLVPGSRPLVAPSRSRQGR